MSNADIAALPIGEMADKDSMLFMWTTHAHIGKAIEVMESWGFTYVTVAFEWLKLTSKGNIVCFMGKWTCGGGIELCLLGRKGRGIKRQSTTVRKLVQAERGRHSAKPPEVRDRIVTLMGNIPRIELFARERVEGWNHWGNEISSDDACSIDANRPCVEHGETGTPAYTSGFNLPLE
jgi:site-specific DNA-methyltransferase (adenine-specific)